MRPFFENNVLQQQPFKPMIIVVDTTKAGSASNTFVLPIIKATTETVKIYWGDGTSSMGVNGNNTHVYAASGVYTVKIESKVFGGIYFNNGGDKAKITKINSMGSGILTVSFNSFSGCTSLSSAVVYSAVSTSASTNYMFLNCVALSYVSLFNMVNAVSAQGMFQGCTSLTTVPLFNLHNITNCQGMFYATGLSTVPLFDLSNVTNTSYMFVSCTSLTTIPLFDMSKVTDATAMFANCNSITTQSYSDFLIHLATLPLQSGVSFHGGNSKYNTAGGVARAYLIANFGWTITDGGAA